jgi:hypothetical protein
LLVLGGIAVWAMLPRPPAADTTAVVQAQPEEPDEFEPPAAALPPARGPDLFQKGTVWKGTLHRAPTKKGDKPSHHPVTLTVLERDGDTFQAHIVIKGPDIIRLVKKGTVKSGTIAWNRTDVAVIQGRGAGGDNVGIVVGPAITLYSQDAPGSGPAGRGRTDLTLER